MRIPAGETLSYTTVAREVGSPNAVRAVGSACGANPVALLVPCHRVVRNDGGLGGYRWGLDRKERLLEAEAAGAVRRAPYDAFAPAGSSAYLLTARSHLLITHYRVSACNSIRA